MVDEEIYKSGICVGTEFLFNKDLLEDKFAWWDHFKWEE